MVNMASKLNAGRTRPNERSTFELRPMNTRSFTFSTAGLLLFCFSARLICSCHHWLGCQPGSKSKPFATLERARDTVRELKRAGKVHKAGLTVWLRGGDFLRTNALELTAADSGTLNGPVVWRAYGNERVRLLGGHALTGFRPVSDAAVLAGSTQRPASRPADRPPRARHHRLRRDEVARLQPANHARALRTVLCRTSDDARPLAESRRVGEARGLSRRQRERDDFGSEIGDLPAGFSTPASVPALARHE